jgi:cytochrome c peroxidase
MRKVVAIVITPLIFFLTSFQNDVGKEIVKWPERQFEPRRENFGTLRELGRKLFYDPSISGDGTISCASCHSPYHSFAHSDHRLSHGIHDSIGLRNAPSLLNLAWHNYFMWDGAIHHLKAVPLAPLHHQGEMASSVSHALHAVNESPQYRHWLLEQNLYPVDTDIFTEAIAVFLSSLVSNNSRYDKMNRGDIVFDPQEQKGYDLFMQHCNRCHTEPLFTSGGVERNGLGVDSVLRDFGVERITRDTADHLKFKVPTLRNLLYSSPYMHDGRFQNLGEVIRHYGCDDSSPLSEKLSAEERTDIAVFLKTLNDSSFVFNPENHYIY